MHVQIYVCLVFSPTNFLQEKTSHIITIMIRRKRENDEKEHVIIMCMISREPYVHKHSITFSRIHSFKKICWTIPFF